MNTMFIICLALGIVFAIGLFIAHSNTKKGVAWGQIGEIVFGILTIICAVASIYFNATGKTATQLTAEKWQEVRGTGAGKVVAEKCAGKKVLVIKNYKVEGQTDYQWEAFSKAIEGLNPKIFELPKPPETAEGEMGPEMMYMEGQTPSPAVKKELEKIAKELQSNIEAQVKPDEYDVVVFAASVPEFTIFKSPLPNPIKAFQDKSFFFLFGIDETKFKKFAKSIIGFISDKSLANPDDYDKDPTGNQDVDFKTRFEFKAGQAK